MINVLSDLGSRPENTVCRSRARVVFPLDEGPEMPITMALSGCEAIFLSVLVFGDVYLVIGLLVGFLSYQVVIWWGSANTSVSVFSFFGLAGYSFPLLNNDILQSFMNVLLVYRNGIVHAKTIPCPFPTPRSR